jgi:hypothetical protein
MNRFALRRACLAFAFLAAGAATAGEMTLYKQPSFGGAQLTLRGDAPEISSLGFSDQASSIVVHSGKWEVCTQPQFKGYCVTLPPAEYNVLDPQLNHRIESARDTESTGPDRGTYNRYGQGSAELFSRPGFDGRSMLLQGDAPSLGGSGFDNRAASIKVNEGTWQLCTEDGYQGSCRIYGPGEYADLGYGMAKQVSSARVVRAARDAPAVLRGGYDAPAESQQPGNARVVLFSDENFRGDSMAVSGPTPALERSGFDNTASSMVIEGGQWLFCSDAYFRGDCRVMGPGRYRTLKTNNLYRSISSIRPAAEAPRAEPPRPGNAADILFFTEPGFAGRSMGTSRDVSNLGPTQFNDRIASIVVNAGRWELCTDGEYGGRCTVVGPGRYPQIGGLENQISSLRRVR